MKNTVELLTEKSNLLSAQQETLQAKYMAILNMQLLKFYQGEKIRIIIPYYMNKKTNYPHCRSCRNHSGGGVWLFGGAKAKHKVTYATATIHKGEISESVTATGTIEPVTEVEVGTQVSGIIDKIHVDYNSVVTKGQLIAEMDRVTHAK